MKTRVLISAVLTAVTVTTFHLRASTVVGIFAIVDDARLEPTESAPERIRITGVFVVPVPVSSGRHRPPARGHLCFTLPAGMEEKAQTDWTAIKSSAGTGQVVGFGQYWVTTARFANGTMNTSLVVAVQNDANTNACQPYPVPNDRGVVTTFETTEDAAPRFGEPSMAIVSRLQEAHKRYR